MKYEQLCYTPEVVQVFLRNYIYLRCNAIKRMNEELIVLCVDIDTAINNVKLTSRQKQALYYYILGYTLEDIGRELTISHPAVVGLINRASERLSQFLEGETV